MLEEPVASVLVMTALLAPSATAELTPEAISALVDNYTTAALVFAKRLRERGVSCVCDVRPMKLKKKLEFSSRLRCYYSIIIGATEFAKKCVQIKDMDTGIQTEGSNEYALNVLEDMCLSHKDKPVYKRIIPDKIIFINQPKGELLKIFIR